ncbi:ubiquitin-protein ligase (E3) [Microbotryomycetes sp. JL221]|nr:ubiquitin-protein ligase (E3) [Microbotryomycetes sp. JL221]
MSGSGSAPFNFSGQHVSRPTINLGGPQPAAEGSKTVRRGDSVIERARQQRIEREHARQRERATVIIQAAYRRSLARNETRRALRATIDSLLNAQQHQNVPDRAGQVIQLTRALVVAFVIDDDVDIKRVAHWCRIVLSPVSSTNKTPLLFATFQEQGIRWGTLLRQMAKLLLAQAVARPEYARSLFDSQHTPLYLELVKLISDPVSAKKWPSVMFEGSTPLDYLINSGLFDLVHRLLIKVPAAVKTHPALPAAITLSMMPFKTNQTADATLLWDCYRSLFSVPVLAHRLPLASVKLVASTFPFSNLLGAIAQGELDTALATLDAVNSLLILSNTLSFVAQRVATFTNSRTLIGYLRLLQSLLHQLPSSTFETTLVDKASSRDVDMIVIDGSDDGQEQDEHLRSMMSRGSRSGTESLEQAIGADLRTRTSVDEVIDRQHLRSVLDMSTRFAATSRPALAAFLVSIMSTFSSKRSSITNNIMFAGTGDVQQRGGGLLRELFRGHIRTGVLGKLIGTGSQKDLNRVALVASLTDESLASEWPVLILLAELYSRCLVTLGDDEFFAQGNPLSLDEVVGFSGLLRNLCFTLYWHSDTLSTQQSSPFVVGSRMTIEQFKVLTTNVLKQIHARDSRRSFTPEDHWSMTSQFDLGSFLQTVIYEDEQVEAEDNASDDEDQLYERPSHARQKVSKRHLAFISPRLGILNNIPFVIPFETRVAVFRQFVENDRQRLGLDRGRFDRRKRHRATVRRTNLAEDAYKQLNGLGKALKGSIEITFVNQFGEEELGIDGGGLFKELLTSLSKEVFDTDRGLWLENQEHELYPNPHSYAREPLQLEWYRFIGRILGKALYEGILVDVRFADFFLAKASRWLQSRHFIEVRFADSSRIFQWLGRLSFLDDLASLDPELYNGLLFLKKHAGNVEADLSLNFTVSDEEFGLSRTIELISGGSDIAVTNDNRIQYIYLVANYRLNVQLEKQYSAFFAGLSEIIPPRWLCLFSQRELRILVGETTSSLMTRDPGTDDVLSSGGIDQDIDLDDLRSSTVYGGWDGEEANDTIRMFWKVVNEFNAEQRTKLIKFVTSCGRPPLLGFKELNPRFAIRHAGNDQTRLPSASTCVNLLKMPAFKDEQTLKTKLLYAIESGAGFDLS